MVIARKNKTIRPVDEAHARIRLARDSANKNNAMCFFQGSLKQLHAFNSMCTLSYKVVRIALCLLAATANSRIRKERNNNLA